MSNPKCSKCGKVYKNDHLVFKPRNVVEFVYKKDCNCIESKATTV